MAVRRLPQFKDEAEEAKWLFEHRLEIAQEIISASRSGEIGEGSRVRHLRRQKESGDSTLSSKSATVDSDHSA